MLTVTSKPFMQGVVKLNVVKQSIVILSVVAPHKKLTCKQKTKKISKHPSLFCGSVSHEKVYNVDGLLTAHMNHISINQIESFKNQKN
jgi:hypothetical protein